MSAKAGDISHSNLTLVCHWNKPYPRHWSRWCSAAYAWRPIYAMGKVSEGLAVSPGLTSRIIEVAMGLPFALASIASLY